MRLSIIFIVCALLFATHVQAQQTSTIPSNVQELYRNCQAVPGTRESVICGQYVSGVGDMMILNSGVKAAAAPSAWKILSKLAICGSPSHTEMRRIFVDWAARHADEWQKARAVGVVEALRASWPCPQ